VSLRDSSLFTGAEGSIHPSPVPELPDTTLRFVFDDVDDDTGANPDAVGAAERIRARAIERFILVIALILFLFPKDLFIKKRQIDKKTEMLCPQYEKLFG